MSREAEHRIVVTEGLSDGALDRLEKVGQVVHLDVFDEDTLCTAVTEADALIVRTYSRVTARVIDVAKKVGRLKVIARAGVGVDNIDLLAARDAGIPVVHTPAASTIAVAELVVGLIVSLHRRIAYMDSQVRLGRFADLRVGGLRPELQYQTLGVIGMGRIGRAVSQRMNLGMKMRIIYYDIREIGYLPFVAEAKASAEEVYSQADFVTLHVPLTKRTRGMIDATALKHFKKGSFLINTSRGPVVEGDALAEALHEGRLDGAAVDVFRPEPPPPDHPLLNAPNTVLTPHIGARSKEGLAAMNDVVDDVIAVLQGKRPLYQAQLDPDA